ncbi:hypothetical protein ACN3XK_23890 [Actinomadura welshii]
MRRAWMIGAVAALVAGLASPAGAAERPWRTTDAPWGLWPQNGLTDLAAAGPQDVWIAGFEGHACVPVGSSAFCSSNAIVRRWDGASWQNRNPPGVWNLEVRDLDAADSGDVWLSGEKGGEAYLARWDGSRWSRVEPPEPCRTASYLAVEAADDGVWVSNGCLARWRDGAWTTYDAGAYVHTLYTVSDTEIWGAASLLGPFQSAVVRWDGDRWTRAELPDGYDNLLAGGPGGVWVEGPGKTELMHYDGGGWTPVPKAPDSTRYRAGDDGSLWAVGDTRSPGAVFSRFDGREWRTTPVPARTGTAERNRGGFDFTAIPGTGGGMYAVGTAPGGGALTMTNH